MMTLDFNARYSVAGYEGVAWRILRWDQYSHEIELESHGSIYYSTEMADSTTVVIAVMVGDDREVQVATEDLTVIADDDYCHGCGQMTCRH